MDITPGLVIEAVFFSILVYVASRLLEWLLDYFQTVRTYRKIKGLPILPFIGNLHQITNNGVDFLKEIKAISIKFSDAPVFMFYRAWQPLIIFHKADYIDVKTA